MASGIGGNLYASCATIFAAREDASPPASEAEIVYWQSLQENNDVEEYGLYLDRFPDGAFADIARSRWIHSEEQFPTSRLPFGKRFARARIGKWLETI
jgi:hypothetical protein